PEGRATLLRRLRDLSDRGVVELTWTLLGAAVGPRYERRLWPTETGVEAAAALAAGERLKGRPLGPRQAEALAEIVADTSTDGVTAGGKTAIYVEAIEASLAAGRPAILLVPEIALATPIVDRLRAELPVRIALVHSGLGDGERADEWRRIRAGDVDLVVGTRT